ncbi:hypothetical protein NE865_06950 [Phthorimaea operculella]|nr:hypothetical protein NE865_06950 [Phthorimaea operculella]
MIDSSDANWWKGYSERGEGLFPANFVTSDLSDPEPKKEIGAKTVQFSDSTAKAVEEEPVEIDESAMDAALAMLHDADVEARSDESALQALEARVLRMGPLVDAALERADTRHARLTQLSAELVRALNLYHELMRDPSRPPHPALGPPPPAPPAPPQPYMPPQLHMHPPPPRC